MLRFLLVFAVCWCLGAPSAFGPAQPQAQTRPADKRIALVIGNGRYPAMPLPNPENDARLIAANLRKLGFEVNEQLNLGVRDFRRVLREFSKRLQEDDAVAVLYYAGHGVQIDGRNYLLPVDLNLRDQEEVKDESVDIEDLFLSRLDRARSSARIVILDACRDNPFAGKTRNVRSAGGLAEMGARGTLIAYASAPGQPAEDGPTGRNSVYTKSLAEEMMVPGLEVEQMFKNVRVKVLRDTKERQVPWVNTSLISNFSFNPDRGGGVAAAAAAAAAAAETGRQARIDRMEAELAQVRRELEAAAQRPRPAAAEPPVVASAPPAAVRAAASGRRDEPNELERQLERARRELNETRVAKAPPSAAQAAAVTQAATATGGARQFLSRGELEQTLIGKAYTMRDAASGNVVRWDIRTGGRLYVNNQSQSNVGGAASGRWELRDDGSLCATLNDTPNHRMQDRRGSEDGCWYFYRAGDKLLRTGAATADASVQAEVTNIR